MQIISGSVGYLTYLGKHFKPDGIILYEFKHEGECVKLSFLTAVRLIATITPDNRNCRVAFNTICHK